MDMDWKIPQFLALLILLIDNAIVKIKGKYLTKGPKVYINFTHLINGIKVYGLENM